MIDLSKDYIHEYQTVCAFTQDYEGAYYHEPWVSAIRENSQVNYNKVLEMSVEEMIAAGYAEMKQDVARNGAGYETGWTIIQIHSGCPVLLENITDFDTWLTSATTFVWREPLPAGWSPRALAEKYSGTTLARPPMVEMFSHVDMENVNELSLSFAGGEWCWPQSSVISQRWRGPAEGGTTATFKTPSHVIVSIRGIFTSVAQAYFSMLSTTTALTLNCGGVFSCHDVTGLFEGNPNLVSLEINGPFRWDGISLCHLMFNNANSLVSIPYVTGWGRNDEANAGYNTIYPHFDGTRGSADCGGLFNASSLVFIGPRLNMNAISLSGCTVDGYNQNALGYGGFWLYNCPELTDVRIINLNNNDWNFADGSTKTYIPKMDVASIEFLLNHVVDCSGTPHTVTFKNTHQNQVSSSAISAAAAKGWTVAWQA